MIHQLTFILLPHSSVVQQWHARLVSSILSSLVWYYLIIIRVAASPPPYVYTVITTECFVPHYNVIIINPTSDYSLLPSFQDPENTSVYRRFDDILGRSILPSH